MASYLGSTIYWTLDLAKVMTWLASSPPYELHRALREMKSIVEESSYSSKDLGRQSFYHPLDAALGVSLTQGRMRWGILHERFLWAKPGRGIHYFWLYISVIHKDAVIWPPLIERETRRLGLTMYLQNPVKS